MDKSIIYFPVKISGILGKIAPEIKVTIPQSVLFAVAKGAAKKAVREELKQHDAQTAQAISQLPTTAADDPESLIDSTLPPDSVRMSPDALFGLIRRRVILDLSEEIAELLENGTVTTLDDLREYLESQIQ